MNINLENKHPLVAFLLALGLIIGAFSFIGAYSLYWYYVLQYVINMVLVPIVGIAKINYVQAVGIGILLSMFKGLGNVKVDDIQKAVGAKTSSWWLLYPILVHFLTWLLFA